MKHILLDENVPHKLGRCLAPHRVETVFDRGWSALTNGHLLSVAETAGFDIMITADQSIVYQQNLAGRRIALIVLDTNRWPFISPRLSSILDAIEASASNGYQRVTCFQPKPD